MFRKKLKNIPSPPEEESRRSKAAGSLFRRILDFCSIETFQTYNSIIL
jgi:hypothetical protein